METGDFWRKTQQNGLILPQIKPLLLPGKSGNVLNWPLSDKKSPQIKVIGSFKSIKLLYFRIFEMETGDFWRKTQKLAYFSPKLSPFRSLENLETS